MKPFSHLGHLAFRVNDLEASIAFYEKLGFPEFLRLTEEDGRPWIVYMRITDDVYVELFPGGNGPVSSNQSQTGLNHLCLTTEDIEATAAHLASVGIALTSPLKADQRGVDGNRGCWIADPDGNRIEIMEMAPHCAQYEAIAALAGGKGKTALVRPLHPSKPKEDIKTDDA